MEDGNDIATSTSLSYGSDWVFDSSLRISICAYDDGTNLVNPIACSAQNLKVQTLMYSSSSIIDFSNSGFWTSFYYLPVWTSCNHCGL